MHTQLFERANNGKPPFFTANGRSFSAVNGAMETEEFIKTHPYVYHPSWGRLKCEIIYVMALDTKTEPMFYALNLSRHRQTHNAVNYNLISGEKMR